MDVLHQIDLRQFNHREHIRLAWLCGRREGREAGIVAFRAALLHVLEKHGDTSKYHATITQFWGYVIAQAINAAPEIDDFALFADQNPPLFDKNLIRQYYRSALLFSEAARQRWIAPDLKPLA